MYRAPALRCLLVDASFPVSASGTVAVKQDSYHTVDFISQPDESIKSLDAKSANPPTVDASGELEAEVYAGAQIQVGELNVIGAGLSAGVGGKGDVTVETTPPQVCISFTPFLRASVYAYLNLWVKEWSLQAFQLEFDLAEFSQCKPLTSVPTRLQLSFWGGNTSYAWIDYVGPATFTVPSGVRSVQYGDWSTPYLVYTNGSVRSVSVSASCPWANNKCAGPITTSVSVGPKIAGLGHVIALGNSSSDAYALLDTGQVQAWGDNDQGQLGRRQHQGGEVGSHGEEPLGRRRTVHRRRRHRVRVAEERHGDGLGRQSGQRTRRRRL